jgi:hypothetical protein
MGNHQNLGHETTDAEVKPILFFLIGLALLLVLALVAMTGLYQFLSSGKTTEVRIDSGLVDSAQIPPAPKLQANPRDDLLSLGDYEKRRLNSYEWVDKNTGMFRIPIDRAMDIVGENGLPTRQQSTEEAE